METEPLNLARLWFQLRPAHLGDGVLSIADIPEFVRNHYEIHEWRHASVILKHEYPNEWDDIMEVLTSFRVLKSEVAPGGGGKAKPTQQLDSGFYDRGWKEQDFDTKFVIDGVEHPSPTHLVDCFKNCVALEVEWNNKDPFYDRDLNNFRLLFELRAVAVGVIVTRTTALLDIFKELGKDAGKSSTHMEKLLPKIEGGGGGGCPILVFGIKKNLYVKDDEVESGDSGSLPTEMPLDGEELDGG